jgi:DNA-binding NarL/FixJ family response regulator
LRKGGTEEPGLESGTTIIIADDHPLFRGALRRAIESLLPNATVQEAKGLDDLSELLAAKRDVDLVLLDLTMPGVQGFSGLIYLRAQQPEVPVVIVSATEDPVVIRRALEFGAAGFIPKSLDTDGIGNAIRTVLSGDVWVPPEVDLAETEDKEIADLVRRLGRLTPQQMRVLMMLSEGLLNKQIAYALSVSEATVKAHVSAILQKLGVDSRTQAVIAASKIGATGRHPITSE